MFWTPAGRVVKWLLELLTDCFIKSPLEQDYGEASEDDIIPPESIISFALPIQNPYTPLISTIGSNPAIKPAQLDRLITRIKELPSGRETNLQFQLDDQGTRVELQLKITKHPNRQIFIIARSSKNITEQIASHLPTPEL